MVSKKHVFITSPIYENDPILLIEQPARTKVYIGLPFSHTLAD